MGCFLGCFGSSNDRKRKKQRYKVIPRDQKPRIQDILKVDASLEQSIRERLSNPVSESREKINEVPLILKKRKKVTFDTNVTTYEHIQVYDSTESLLEKNEKGETFPKSQPGSVVSSMPNYRYGNCVESDDEIDDLEHEDYDFDLDDDDYDLDNDEEQFDDNIDDDYHDEVSVPSMELKRNTRDNSGYIPSVLNPVENLSQWKALKSNGLSRKPLTFNVQKENLNSSELDDQNQETAVDSSLSNWLISSEKITRNNKRVACYNTQLEFKG